MVSLKAALSFLLVHGSILSHVGGTTNVAVGNTADVVVDGELPFEQEADRMLKSNKSDKAAKNNKSNKASKKAKSNKKNNNPAPAPTAPVPAPVPAPTAPAPAPTKSDKKSKKDKSDKKTKAPKTKSDKKKSKGKGKDSKKNTSSPTAAPTEYTGIFEIAIDLCSDDCPGIQGILISNGDEIMGDTLDQTAIDLAVPRTSINGRIVDFGTCSSCAGSTCDTCDADPSGGGNGRFLQAGPGQRTVIVQIFLINTGVVFTAQELTDYIIANFSIILGLLNAVGLTGFPSSVQCTQIGTGDVLPPLVATDTPTNQPSEAPTTAPSANPSDAPSGKPSGQPSDSPSDAPTLQPSDSPSDAPTLQPSDYPSQPPSDYPSQPPSVGPSQPPSVGPSDSPSEYPSDWPSHYPSHYPSVDPSNRPTPMP